MRFYGPDNLKLELVGVSASKIHKNQSHIWSTPHISTNNAIRHFHSATLTVSSLELIEPVLTKVLGYKKINTQHQSVLYQASGNHRAIFLKVEVMPQLEPGFNASGTVHHIAFGVNNEAEQLKVRSLAIKAGMFPTPVINRYYFKSVYFRTPAGILFEIATNGPGFLVDQTEAELGHKLALPPFLEPQRRIIESRLKPI